MAYEKQTWANGPDGGTPLSADRLNHIEDGIENIELTPGPKGAKGDTGAASTVAGPKGEPGFPTEVQWDDLVARVEALEAL